MNLRVSKCREILGISIDSALTFESHINKVCKKSSQKLSALVRRSPCMALEKRRTIMKAFIASHFAYCLLVWMLHSRGLNNKNNSLHERALRVTYGDKLSSKNLLGKDRKITLLQYIKETYNYW